MWTKREVGCAAKEPPTEKKGAGSTHLPSALVQKHFLGTNRVSNSVPDVDDLTLDQTEEHFFLMSSKSDCKFFLQ